jgi:hypothetical protein
MPHQRRHVYDLFSAGHLVGRLVWRTQPRAATGWYFAPRSGPAERLAVDPLIDDLARDTRPDAHTWEVDAALAATLSTALALDAAERRVHRRPARTTGRFRRLTGRARVELYLTGVEPRTLRYAVPELALEAVADVTVLAGSLLPGDLEAITRRLALLGGRVLATFGDDTAAEAA